MFEQWDQKPITFETVDELLSMDWIARRKNYQDGDFYRFSISENRLMAEYAEGKKWWVVGFLEKPIDLPKWEPVYS